MGNELSRSGFVEEENLTWKTRETHEKQFEALALVLPRTPSYLGLVALNLKRERVKEISASCAKLCIKTNTETTAEEQKRFQVLTKFALLLEWKKESAAPTSGRLEQHLWQAGYDLPATAEILKRRWSLKSRTRQTNQPGSGQDRGLLLPYLGLDDNQMNNLRRKLKLNPKAEDKCRENRAACFDGVLDKSSIGEDSRKSHFKALEYKYIEVADVGTQTTDFYDKET